MTGVYLALNQGVTEPCAKLGRTEGIRALKDRARTIRKMVPELSLNGFSLADDIDLKSDPGLGADYETSTIAYKFYATDAIPNDTEMLSDLEAVLQAYDLYLKSPVPLGTAEPSEESLGAPFNEIFDAFVDAQVSFSLLHSTLLTLGVEPRESARESRVSLTLVRQSGHGFRLRLNFGNWAILTFFNQSEGANRVQYICREDLLPASAPEVKKEYRFADRIDGYTFVLTACPAASFNDFESPERKAFEDSLPLIAQRFMDWKGSPFSTSHQTIVLDMVFDTEVRDKRLREGLEIIQENSIPPASLQSILRRYHAEQIVFTSSGHGRRYVVDSVDDEGVLVARLDGEQAQRVTFSRALRLVESVQAAGIFEFRSLDDTSAVRNTVLQSESLALASDQSTVAYVADHGARLENFLNVLIGMRREQPLYKPLMLLCVLDGLDSGDLSSNQFSFDWIAPRFIALMKGLGVTVTEREITSAKDDGWAALSAVGSLISKNNPSFDPRNYGCQKLSELVRKQPYLEVKESPMGEGSNASFLHVRIR